MPRQQRELTLATVAVLRWLRDHPDSYGLELMRQLHYPSGLAYPVLARLEADGLAASTWEDVDPSAAGRPRRRLYRLTDQGRAEADRLVAEARRLLGLS